MGLLGKHPICRKCGDEHNRKARERSAQRRERGLYPPSTVAKWSNEKRARMLEVRRRSFFKGENDNLALPMHKWPWVPDYIVKPITPRFRFQTKLVLFKDRRGHYRWHMKRSGRIVAESGEGYTRLHSLSVTLRRLLCDFCPGDGSVNDYVNRAVRAARAKDWKV